MSTPGNAPPVESPCVDVCTIDAVSGLCLGCKRTLDEIAGWPGYTDGERLDVLTRLEGRTVPAAEPAA